MSRPFAGFGTHSAPLFPSNSDRERRVGLEPHTGYQWGFLGKIGLSA
jgi:hypothetical protein